MAKYRKKPVIVEATQWFPGVKIEGVEETKLESYENFGRIETLEGLMTVSSGDWILTEIVSGKKYPCKPDIFEKTYDEVTDILI